MMFSRNQLAAGLAEYLQNDVSKAVPEMPLKVAMYTIAHQLRTNPAALDAALSSSVARMALPSADGRYDISGIAESLKAAAAQYGGVPITIPAIPLISKGEKTLTLNAQDIDRLKDTIERAPE